MSVFYAIRFIQKLTTAKLANSISLRWHHLLMRLGDNCNVTTMPESLTVEPIAACNLKCPQCTIGSGNLQRKRKQLLVSSFANILAQTKRHLVYCQFFLQGEPTLCPELCQMIELANKNGIITGTSTNGHFLTPQLCHNLIVAGLDRIIISVDGTDQTTYEKYRVGGKLQTVIEGIGNLASARRSLKKHNPEIIVQFIVFKHNEHQISEIKHLAKKWGADKVEIKSAQIEQLDQADNWLPQHSHINRYKKAPDGSFYINKKYPLKCLRLRSVLVVNSDGLVMPCCFDKNGQHYVGNTNKQAVKQIWQGAAFNSLRNRVWKNADALPMCKNCNEL